MNAKTNLLRNKELVKWWVSIAHDDRFADIVTHARAMIAESTPTQEQLKGAENLLSTLETMTDNDEAPNDFPTPGLHHKIDRVPERKNHNKE